MTVIDEVKPSFWLTEHVHLLPRSGRGLDVACGKGRHAIWLARRGIDVLAIDRDRSVVAALNEEARRQRLPLRAEVVDLESGRVDLGTACYDIIVVVHYLHRPLFPALIAALRPGGVLVYETFTRAQAARGRPTNPDFLLGEGELRELVHPLEILVEREGDFSGKMLSSVIARKPALK